MVRLIAVHTDNLSIKNVTSRIGDAYNNLPEIASQLGLSFYQFFTGLPVKNFYQFTGKLEW